MERRGNRHQDEDRNMNRKSPAWSTKTGIGSGSDVSIAKLALCNIPRLHTLSAIRRLICCIQKLCHAVLRKMLPKPLLGIVCASSVILDLRIQNVMLRSYGGCP